MFERKFPYLYMDCNDAENFIFFALYTMSFGPGYVK